MKCANCGHGIILYKSMDGGRYWKHTDGVHFYDNCKLLNDDCGCTNPDPNIIVPKSESKTTI